MTADPMVSTEWLAARLDDPSVKLLDATWRMPGDPADPRADFEAGRISGAQFFAIDEIADRSTDLPHMAPSPEQFAEAVGALGISNANTVVVYDQLGLFSAARVWWTFRLFGHERVFVLDSGLPKWLAEERPVVSGSLEKPAAAAYRTRLEPRLVKSLDDVRTALASNSPNIADARPAPRFCGEQAEPRPGLRPGHMPGAHSLPFGQLINPDGTLKSAEDIEAAFAAAGVSLDRPVIATCGSGLTAAILVLALARCGRWDASVYDGSWVEWGGRADTLVVTGAES